MNSHMVTLPDSDKLLLVQFLSTEEGSEKNSGAIGAIVDSLKKAE